MNVSCCKFVILKKQISMNILLLGSGGRECALAWKLSQSTHCDKLYIAPGNAGTLQYGQNVPIDPLHFEALAKFSIEHNIQLLVVGPEAPLVEGIVDFFENRPELRHINVLGPKKSAAMLEGSKSFAKAFMKRHNIPTANYASFPADKYEEALSFIYHSEPPYVVKADGLAAGKGVSICPDAKSAQQTIDAMMKQECFGKAGKTIVIEQYLQGIELSVFILTDGRSFVMLPEAKDYKRIGDGDTGPNTGGMGSVSPVPFVSKTLKEKIIERIIQPTIAGIQYEQLNFKGFLFIGLMIVNGEPVVLEYNVRLGDPETQAILPRIENDFVELILSVFDTRLSDIQLQCSPQYCVNITIAAKGYPGQFEKGNAIEIPAVPENVFVFHAGTKLENNQIVSNGGRVLSVCAKDSSPFEAIRKAYDTAQHIKFAHKYYRTDIGKDIFT